ncbi:hypothetical protein FHR32_002477 [Streptosporangium album]|uniref:Uncharacterized protein n=1 Tax=Streptosporangium album TaxID=47479 RepID=A0A7W7W8C8_9ACTN|nr:hypothetical protein [Streptosporangium album]MBB4938172.1 hypothetical protein [Streptosporangium album]
MATPLITSNTDRRGDVRDGDDRILRHRSGLSDRCFPADAA